MIQRSNHDGRSPSADGSARLALALLLALFTARVLTEFALRALGSPFSNPAEVSSGGLPPYWAALSVQLAIIGLMMFVIRLITGPARPRLGRAMIFSGVASIATVLFEAFAGVADLLPHAWFNTPIQTSFHLVVAAFLLIAGWQLLARDKRARFENSLRRAARVTAYPSIMAAALGLYFWNLDAGYVKSIAAYHAVVLGGTAIVVAEILMPYRTAWRPDRREVSRDAAYLLLVQVALPALGTAVVVSLTGHDLAVAQIWPQDLPVLAQLALMLLLADFVRYWLHRACHANRLLWRLHAVHHAPEELHALNVGRFHPLEKGLQFTLDTIPFILLGVSDTVVGCYLVFYAINGFFQHSNVDAKLGAANWIVAGPELHRWHHSRSPRLSDHNFGNNLIVWDLLFGTRLLPEGEEVGELGLVNRAYPRDLAGQIFAPFTVDPNRRAR